MTGSLSGCSPHPELPWFCTHLSFSAIQLQGSNSSLPLLRLKNKTNTQGISPLPSIPWRIPFPAFQLAHNRPAQELGGQISPAGYYSPLSWVLSQPLMQRMAAPWRTSLSNAQAGRAGGSKQLGWPSHMKHQAALLGTRSHLPVSVTMRKSLGPYLDGRKDGSGPKQANPLSNKGDG